MVDLKYIKKNECEFSHDILGNPFLKGWWI